MAGVMKSQAAIAKNLTERPNVWGSHTMFIIKHTTILTVQVKPLSKRGMK